MIRFLGFVSLVSASIAVGSIATSMAYEQKLVPQAFFNEEASLHQKALLNQEAFLNQEGRGARAQSVVPSVSDEIDLVHERLGKQLKRLEERRETYVALVAKTADNTKIAPALRLIVEKRLADFDRHHGNEMDQIAGLCAMLDVMGESMWVIEALQRLQ